MTTKRWGRQERNAAPAWLGGGRALELFRDALGTCRVQSPHPSPPDPRVQVQKYGEQKKLFISPGLLPEVPPRSELPKPEATASARVDSGESGWPCRQGGVSWLFSHCPPRSPLLKTIHLFPTATTAASNAPPVSQVRGSRREGGRPAPPPGASCEGRLMEDAVPQGPGATDKELVLGLGHLNNTYNFSVSVRSPLGPTCPPLPPR